MKTMGKLSFGLLAAALILLFAIPGFTAEQKAVTLKWAMPSPPSSVFEKNQQWIGEEITRRTNGRVKFDFFWSGTLLKYQDIVVGIGKGVADVGQGSGPVYREFAPYLDHTEPGCHREGLLGHAVGLLRYDPDKP